MENYRLKFKLTDSTTPHYDFTAEDTYDSIVETLNNEIVADYDNPEENRTISLWLTGVSIVDDVSNQLFFTTTPIVTEVVLYHIDENGNKKELGKSNPIKDDLYVDGKNIGESDRRFLGITTDKSVKFDATGWPLTKMPSIKGNQFAAFADACVINHGKQTLPKVVFSPHQDSIFSDNDYALDDSIDSFDQLVNIKRIIPLTDNRLVVLSENASTLVFLDYNEDNMGNPIDIGEEYLEKTDALFKNHILDIGFDYKDDATWEANEPTDVDYIYAVSLNQQGFYEFKRLKVTDFNPLTITESHSINAAFASVVPANSSLVSMVVTKDKVFAAFSVKNPIGISAITPFAPNQDEGEVLAETADLLFSFDKALFDEEGMEGKVVNLSLQDDTPGGYTFARSMLPFNPMQKSRYGWAVGASGGGRQVRRDNNSIVHPYGDDFEQLFRAILFRLRDGENTDNSNIDIGHLAGIGTNSDNSVIFDHLRVYASGQLCVMDYMTDVVGYYVFASGMQDEDNVKPVLFCRQDDQNGNPNELILNSGSTPIDSKLSGHSYLRYRYSANNTYNRALRTKRQIKTVNPTETNDFMFLWNGVQKRDFSDKIWLMVGATGYDVSDNPVLKYFEARFLSGECFRHAVPMSLDDSDDSISMSQRHNMRVFSGKLGYATIQNQEYPSQFGIIFCSPYHNQTLKLNNSIANNPGDNQDWQIRVGYHGNGVDIFAGNGQFLDAVISTEPTVDTEDVNKGYVAHWGDNVVTVSKEFTQGDITAGVPFVLGNHTAAGVLLFDLLELDYTPVTGGEEIFVEDYIYRYRISFVYDGFQEGPLSRVFFDKLIETLPEGDFVERMKVKVNLVPLIKELLNKRVSHICIYASKLEGGSEGELYSLVREIELSSNNFKKQPDLDYESYEFFDEGVRLGSFEAINGYSETLESVSVLRQCQSVCQGYLFAGNCVVPGEMSRSIPNIIIRSKPGKYSIFNYPDEFLMLPFTPIVMADFQSKLWVFGDSGFCVVDPNALAIEHEGSVFGGEDKRHVIVHEDMMFIFYKGCVYAVGGGKMDKISQNVDYIDNNTYGIQAGLNTQLLFSERRNALMVIQETEDDKLFVYVYNIQHGLWAVLDIDYENIELLGSFIDKEVEASITIDKSGLQYTYRPFMGDNMLMNLQYYLPSGAPEGKMYAYGWYSDTDLDTNNGDEVKLAGDTLPKYDDNSTKQYVNGGILSITLDKIIRNFTLFIRRLLPYAKPD